MITGWDHGLSFLCCLAIIWTSAGLLLNGSLRNEFPWNLNQNTVIYIQENPVDNIIGKLANRQYLSWPQCFTEYHSQEMTTPGNERIVVRAGDVYGIHYPSGATRGMAPYDQSGRSLCCGVSLSDLSRVLNEEKFDSDLPIGTVLTVFLHSTLTRLPALRPTAQGKRKYWLHLTKYCVSKLICRL